MTARPITLTDDVLLLSGRWRGEAREKRVRDHEA